MKDCKNVLITGATGAIGFGIAKLIAELPGFNITIVARDKIKAEKAVKKLIQTTKNENISFVLADLSRKQDIATLAENWTEPLHVLINDAGATPRQREETPEGIEMQLATNVLGYFWMMKYFTPYLANAAPSRIVNVASYWAGDMDINDLEFKNRHYNNDTAYRQSKQANRMLTVAFAEKLKSKNITVNACHPGDVRSTLASNLGYGGHESPSEGAATPVWLATSPDVAGITGKYFEHLQESQCRYGQNKKMVDQLFEICEKY